MKKVAYGKLDPVRGTSKFGGGERWCVHWQAVRRTKLKRGIPMNHAAEH